MYHDDGDANLSVGDDIIWAAKHKLCVKYSLKDSSKGTVVCMVDHSSMYVHFDSQRPRDADQCAATLVSRDALADMTTIEVGTHVTLKKKFRCAKTVVTKGTIGRVLRVHDGHLWMNVTQDKENIGTAVPPVPKIGTGALKVERKNVCALAGCIPRRWEVAADFASHVTELLLGTLCSLPRAHATATHHTECLTTHNAIHCAMQPRPVWQTESSSSSCPWETKRRRRQGRRTRRPCSSPTRL